MQIDLNCDMGESYGRWSLGEDVAVLRWVTSANIACGLHAGDPPVMRETLKLAKQAGVGVGAHPGYPDLQGFGRREMALNPAEVEAFVLYQVGALGAMARAEGIELTHVKPHGALYNQAARDIQLAQAVSRAVFSYSHELILVGLAGSRMAEAAHEIGLRFAGEGFPDRAYRPDGTLQPRSEPGAVLESVEAVCAQALSLARGGRGVQVETLCIHGDSGHAARYAQAVSSALTSAGWSLRGLSTSAGPAPAV